MTTGEMVGFMLLAAWTAGVAWLHWQIAYRRGLCQGRRQGRRAGWRDGYDRGLAKGRTERLDFARWENEI